MTEYEKAALRLQCFKEAREGFQTRNLDEISSMAILIYRHIIAGDWEKPDA